MKAKKITEPTGFVHTVTSPTRFFGSRVCGLSEGAFVRRKTPRAARQANPYAHLPSQTWTVDEYRRAAVQG